MQWNEFQFQVRHLPTTDQKLVEQAFKLGEKAHEHQKRQSGDPYFTHPIAVAQILANMGGDTDTIIAALLHDTVEDTPVTLDEIKETFGPAVTMLIDGVTKLCEQDIPQRSSLNEQIETLRKMFNLMQKDVRIMVIKIADRLHNMQTISFRSQEKQLSVARETMEVYVKIADRLSMRDIRDELESMCLGVLETGVHQQLLDLRKRNEQQGAIIVPYMSETLQKTYDDLPFVIQMEKKSWDSLRRQYERQRQTQMASGQINLAFICENVQDCYRTLGMLHQLWQREALSFEDYINAPVINGYKALHTTIILEDGARVRCKIRTQEMDKYAHKGITTLCFDSASRGATDYLKWTAHISPLSKDSADRSAEFWQSLQNDILGESILIHGESDQTQLLPKGATALDAVFYLYGERALFTKEIYIDDHPVPFYEQVSYANNIGASFASTPQVDLNWLQYIHTGISTAIIRNGLAQRDPSEKRALGEEILHRYLRNRRRGYISELDRSYIDRQLKQHGYLALDEMYVQIAEGRISAPEVDQLIFRNQPNTPAETAERHVYVITMTIPHANKKVVEEIMKFYDMQSYRMLRNDTMTATYRVKVLLNENEMNTLSYTLEHVIRGGYAIRRPRTIYTASVISVLLFILWGLDPTGAHMILGLEGVTPVDLTIVRFASQAVLSGLFLVWMRMRQPLPEARLSLKNSSLWLSVIFLFCVAVTTYYSLRSTLPLHYTIPMTSAGLLLTTLVNRRRVGVLIATWLLVAIGMGLLVAFTPLWTPEDIVFTMLAVLSFTGFSIISERYKRQEQVSLRSAQYFFLLASLCTLLSLPLLPSSSFTDISGKHLGYMVLFSVFVSGVPYYIYYYLLSHKEIDFVLRYSFLIIPATFISEILLIGPPNIPTLLAGLIVMCGAFLPLLLAGSRSKSMRKRASAPTAGFATS